ncbi:MAG: hypothetical protein PHT46_04495 [Candidatus Marinimicrobia bacterium]|nr:hypothetical protein [Candidatus Neomarinimicrobiota bacterium]
MRILKLFLLTAGLSLLVLASCDLFTPQPEPGSRNYVWEIDTLYMPMNYISSVWGASPNDLWAIGAGGTDNDRLLHYDGTNWSTYTNEVIKCTGNTIFGFSEDNIWMGGGAEWPDIGGAIWHYDGQKWDKHFIYDPDISYNRITITDIWGNDKKDVYACGEIYYQEGTIETFNGFVLHFNGISWSEIARADFNSQFLRINEDNDNVYIFSFGINYNGADTVAFFTINNDSLYQIYSNTEDIINWAGMTNIDGKEYFAMGNDVYIYDNEVFNKVFSMNYGNFWWKVFGRNEKDIFFLMRDGFVHYNGTDMEYIYQMPSADMRFVGEPLIIDDHIYYCLGYPGLNELILHGKLDDIDQE